MSRSELLCMINKRGDFLVQLDYFSIYRHKNALICLHEFSNILIDDSFTVLRVVQMIINQTVFTNEGLVLTTKL